MASGSCVAVFQSQNAVSVTIPKEKRMDLATNTSTSRRTFLQNAPLCGAALVGASSVLAAQTKSDPLAGGKPIQDEQLAAPPTYEIYALRYASKLERTRNENFIFDFDPHDSPMPMDYFVWLLKSGQHMILVDSGFNEASGKARNRFLSCDPIHTLSILGIDLNNINDVIITHLHYDHAGNLSKLPRARLHLQDAEMEYATGRYMRQRVLRGAYSAEDVVEVVRGVYQDRVFFHRGNEQIVPGVEVIHIGGHTRGLQSVRVFTQRGWVLLASDAAHYYDNMRLQNPFPIVFNTGDMISGYDILSHAVDSIDHIVPGHDPAVMRLYPPLPNTGADVVCLHLPPSPAGPGGFKS
jgi:glyoxylase-like metal-dependent hydrolase (beta-lactamase superfamily II)